MNENASSGPTPVVPLEYATRDNEEMRFVLRAVAFIFIVWQFNHLLTYLLEFAAYLWELNDPAVVRKLLTGASIAIRTPQAIVSLYLVANCAGILRLSRDGLRWIVNGSIIQAVLSLLYCIAMTIYMIVGHRVFARGIGYGSWYAGQYVIFAMSGPLEYLAIASVFRSRAASASIAG
jgi:hypothetical protein